MGELSYAIFYNPYHVIKRAYQDKLVQESKWQSLVIRANEIGAFDLDDIDDSGALIAEEDEEVVEKSQPKSLKLSDLKPFNRSSARKKRAKAA